MRRSPIGKDEPVDTDETHALRLVLLTGMSGAGRSTAARALEDLGWFVIDNIPPALIDDAVQLARRTPDVDRVAVVVDVRGGRFFPDLVTALDVLPTEGVRAEIVFLEASDEAIVRRYESSRRPHPLQNDLQTRRIIDGVLAEREMLGEVRAAADLVIDTTNLNVHDVRRRMEAAFVDTRDLVLLCTVMSFGFKYGIPVDADMVGDVRFLPNPYWDERLRPMSGLDAPVADDVLGRPGAQEFLDAYQRLTQVVADGYIREGKRFVTIAIGCTGGRHRSVAMTQALANRLNAVGINAVTVNRDLGRE